MMKIATPQRARNTCSHSLSVRSVARMPPIQGEVAFEDVNFHYLPDLPVLKNINLTMKSMHYEPDYFYLEVDEIAERFRPLMIDLPEYRQKRGLDNKAAA